MLNSRQFTPICSCWTEPAKPTPTQEEVKPKDAKISAENVADEDDDEDFEIIEPDDEGVVDETLEKGFLLSNIHFYLLFLLFSILQCSAIFLCLLSVS